jgi:hypothetical protein
VTNVFRSYKESTSHKRKKGTFNSLEIKIKIFSSSKHTVKKMKKKSQTGRK